MRALGRLAERKGIGGGGSRRIDARALEQPADHDRFRPGSRMVYDDNRLACGLFVHLLLFGATAIIAPMDS